MRCRGDVQEHLIICVSLADNLRHAYHLSRIEWSGFDSRQIIRNCTYGDMPGSDQERITP